MQKAAAAVAAAAGATAAASQPAAAAQPAEAAAAAAAAAAAHVMLVRGCAEFRRSPSGAREMCVPTGPASEMRVPKPFSCFFFALHENQRPALPVNI